MPLPSGQISFSQVNVELGLAATTQISLNQANVRTLAGVPSGAISMQNLQGKANASDFVSMVFKPTGTAESGGDTGFYGVTSNSNGLYTTGYFAFQTPTESFFTLSYYTPTGSLNWHKQYSGPVEASPNGLYTLGTDGSGNLYTIIQYGSGNFTLIKFNSSGTTQWAKNLYSAVGTESYILATDSSGNCYVGSNSGSTGYIAKVDTNGSLSWVRSLSGYTFRCIYTDGTNVYVGGSKYTSAYNSLILKLNSSGTLTAQRELTTGTYGYVGSITTDPSGNVCFSMVRDFGSGNYHTQFHKFDSSLNVVWANGVGFTVSGQQVYPGGPDGIVTDSSGDVYGILKTGGSAFIVTRINSSGVLQWQRAWYRGASNTTGTPYSIAFTSAGKIVVSGTQSGGSFNQAGFMPVVPVDGSKTGSYTLNGVVMNYAAGAFTTTTPAPTTSTPSLSLTTGATPALNNVTVTTTTRTDLVTSTVTM